MRKRLRILLILLAICAFGAVGYYLLHSSEPSFEGRRLSQWVLVMHSQVPGPEKDEARAIVRQLVTNSIPLLLRWLKEPDRPSLDERIYDSKSKLFGWLAAHHLFKLRSMGMISDGPNHRTIAAWALAELDQASKKAVIPVLISMLGDKKRKQGEISEMAGRAFIVLPMLEPESVGPLIDALSSQDVQVSALAAGALGNIGPPAKAAVPILEQRLQDSDPNIRVSTAEIIGKLGGDPNVFVPVVIHCLSEVDRDNLDYPLNILVRYKEQSKAGVPDLLRILSKTAESTNAVDIMIHAEVLSALQEIAPEAIAKAGGQ